MTALARHTDAQFRAELARRRAARSEAKRKAAQAAWRRTPRGRLLSLRRQFKYKLGRAADPDRRREIADMIMDVELRLEKLREGGGA